MSVIFGFTRRSQQVVADRDLIALGEGTQAYAPDGTFVFAKAQLGMAFQAYHTHDRSKLEAAPSGDLRGNLLTFAGRLDNYAELIEMLGDLETKISDSRIVLRAFDKWGEDCFSRLIGEWALALWVEATRTLYLARDHAGTRPLYFEVSNKGLLWSTCLETFFIGRHDARLNEDFASRYLSCRPLQALTPYKGIEAVPPSHYVRFRDDRVSYRAHWQWITKEKVSYATNEQYEEHFYQLFRRSVCRRSGPGAPILAQLSGGMDSTSIVCMADEIRRSHNPPLDIFDTLSFFDQGEPDWDEAPFFRVVEENRGKTGVHLDVSYSNCVNGPACTHIPMQFWPGSNSYSARVDLQLHNVLKGRGIRAILSGLGGDEVLGGVPVPFPELADLMVKGKLLSLSKRSVEWCLAKRMPILHMLLNNARFTYDLYCGNPSASPQIPPWLCSRQSIEARDNFVEETLRPRLRVALPSRISQGNAWWAMLETLPNRLLSNYEKYEYRYPYLDRELVEFLFSIPRSQIVQPGRRRSLMRRAFKALVPIDVLDRRRKAFVSRRPFDLIRHECEWISAHARNLHCVEMGLVDPSSVPGIVEAVARRGDRTWLPQLMSLITFELWLRNSPLAHSATATLSGKQDPNLLPRLVGFQNSEI